MFFNHKNTEPGQPQGSNPFFYYGGNYPGETSEPFYHSGIKNYNLRVSISTHIGKVRGNHEDNFYLEGLYMNDIFRNDFSASYTIHYADGMSFAVFDVWAVQHTARSHLRSPCRRCGSMRKS